MPVYHLANNGSKEHNLWPKLPLAAAKHRKCRILGHPTTQWGV